MDNSVKLVVFKRWVTAYDHCIGTGIKRFEPGVYAQIASVDITAFTFRMGSNIFLLMMRKSDCIERMHRYMGKDFATVIFVFCF